MCSERGMNLASFEQPAESNSVLDFLSGTCETLKINIKNAINPFFAQRFSTRPF